MFCPRCSQEQVSNEVKFCTRCGFLLSDVAEALQNDGKVGRNLIQADAGIRRDALKGVAFMAVSAAFALASLILGTPEPGFIVQLNLIVAAIAFLVGIAFIAYVFWLKPYVEYGREIREEVLREIEPDIKEIVKDAIKTKSDNKRLKEADFSQTIDYAAPSKSYATAELIEKPSVTEDTTKNLQLDKN